MSTIRAATPEDAEQISDLFCSAFRGGPDGKTRELTDYLEKLYLHSNSPGIESIVHENNGRITGFLGVYPVPMTFRKRPVVAAVCGSFAVLNPQDEPMAAPRIMRTFLNGPQDLSLSETANKVSHAVWTGAGGNALVDYSLKWHRPISPLAYALHLAGEKSGFVDTLLPVLNPVARLFDRLGLALFSPRPKHAEDDDFAVEAAERDEFVSLYAECTRQFDPKPAFVADQLSDMLDDAQQKPDLGRFFTKKVLGKGGRPIGAIAYHYKTGGVMHVLQMLARPKAEANVLDALISHARDVGAIGLIGRMQQRFAVAMQGRKTYFLIHDWTVVHAKDKDIVAAYCNGDGFANGFVGEYWNRLNNGI